MITNHLCSRITGYEASHSLQIEFKNFDSAGQFIDQVAVKDKADQPLKSGINIQGIQWDSDKKGQTETDCLTAAVKLARSRADDLAKAAGVKIKGIYEISNQQVYSDVEASSTSYTGRAVAKSMMMTADSSSQNATSLTPSKIKVRADVSMSFLIQN